MQVFPIIVALKLEALSFWMEKHPDSLHWRFSKGFVLESIKIILENDDCTFNDEFCRQISGQLWKPFLLQHMLH